MRPYDSLRGRREFVLALRRGATASSPAVTVSWYRPRGAQNGLPKVGVIVPGSVGPAVVRNRVRRRCKAILDGASLEKVPDWFVVQCRREAKDLTFEELRDQLMNALASARRRSGKARRA